MFESFLRIPGHSEAGADAPLATVEWSALVARLAAARDLRRSLLAEGTAGGASFDPAAAAMLAHRGDDEREINPEGLVDGKQPWTTTAADLSKAPAGDREH